MIQSAQKTSAAGHAMVKRRVTRCERSVDYIERAFLGRPSTLDVNPATLPRNASSALPRLPVLVLSRQDGRQDATVPDLRSSGAALYTTSGRAAIALALESLGVGRGDRVLVPTYHCPTMVAPIERLGAEAEFYPIDADGRPLLDRIAHVAPAPRAMIVPHFFGLGRDLAAVRAYCDAQGTALIEDCAHSFFGNAGSRPMGQWGDITTGSLTKFFPGPDGGLLVLRNRAARPVALRSPSAPAEARAWIDAVEVSVRYGKMGLWNAPLSALFGMKRALRGGAAAQRESTERLTDPAAIKACLDEGQIPLQASAVVRWIVRTANLQSLVDTRQRNYRALVAALARSPLARPVFPDLPNDAVPYVCPVLVADADAVYTRMRSAGLPVFRWDVLWPGTPSLEGDTGQLWSKLLLQVACHQDLTPADMERMAAELSRGAPGATA
jgi:hypothetical protein